MIEDRIIVIIRFKIFTYFGMLPIAAAYRPNHLYSRCGHHRPVDICHPLFHPLLSGETNSQRIVEIINTISSGAPEGSARRCYRGAIGIKKKGDGRKYLVM